MYALIRSCMFALWACCFSRAGHWGCVCPFSSRPKMLPLETTKVVLYVLVTSAHCIISASHKHHTAADCSKRKYTVRTAGMGQKRRALMQHCSVCSAETAATYTIRCTIYDASHLKLICCSIMISRHICERLTAYILHIGLHHLKIKLQTILQWLQILIVYSSSFCKMNLTKQCGGAIAEQEYAHLGA